LQPTDERGGSHVIIVVIYQSHLDLEITDILLEALPMLHFEGEKMVAVLLELSTGSVLVVEGMLHLLESLERLRWECVEPVIGGTFDTGWEYTTQK